MYSRVGGLCHLLHKLFNLVTALFGKFLIKVSVAAVRKVVFRFFLLLFSSGKPTHYSRRELFFRRKLCLFFFRLCLFFGFSCFLYFFSLLCFLCAGLVFRSFFRRYGNFSKTVHRSVKIFLCEMF